MGIADLITPWKPQQQVISGELYNLRRKMSVPRTRMARVITVDASTGSEAYMVILSTVITPSAPVDMEFFAERERANIAMTRAREVFWIVGGDLAVKDISVLRPFTSPPLIACKNYLGKLGRVHRISQPQVETVPEDLDVLDKSYKVFETGFVSPRDATTL